MRWAPIRPVSCRTPAPSRLLVLSLGALIVADLLLSLSAHLASDFAGIALWGVHMALSQGLLSKLVADRAPAALRATAFGVFNLSAGLMLLAASVMAGALWEYVGAFATFLTGAGLAALAAFLILILLPEGRRSGNA
ncbi:MAG: hypothetical protein R3B98_10340 [Hyphomonas sp.]